MADFKAFRIYLGKTPKKIEKKENKNIVSRNRALNVDVWLELGWLREATLLSRCEFEVMKDMLCPLVRGTVCVFVE